MTVAKGSMMVMKRRFRSRVTRHLAVAGFAVTLMIWSGIANAQGLFESSDQQLCRTCTKPTIIFGDEQPTVVPLPPALPLSLAGLGAFWLLRRSRNQKSL
ncbi:MAG: hypothetical protein AAFQ38_17120 [Pseudomonadota bacterium]